VKQAASALLRTVESPASILQNIDSIVHLGLQNLAVKSLRRWIPGVISSRSTGKQLESSWNQLTRMNDRVSLDVPQDLDDLSSLEKVNIELLTAAAHVSSSVRDASKHRLLGLGWNSDMVLRLGTLVAACFEDADDLRTLGTAFWEATAACAFEHNADAAISLVEAVTKSSPSNLDIVAGTMNELLAQRRFKVSTKSLQLTNMLLTIKSTSSRPIESGKILDACIHTLVRGLSGQAVLGAEILSLIRKFSRSR
jgi:hypothetical protein